MIASVNANDDGTITIDDSWFGKTITLVKKGNGTTSSNSIAQSITLAARPAAPACTATQPSAESATGTISGITTAMEYSTDSGNFWTDGNNSDVTGFVLGTVLALRTVSTLTGILPGNKWLLSLPKDNTNRAQDAAVLQRFVEKSNK